MSVPSSGSARVTRGSAAAAAFSAVLAAVVAAPPAAAQISSEAPPSSRTVPVAEEISRTLKYSRYHLGAVRLQPFLALRDLGYNNNLYGTSGSDTTGDWTGTVSGGTKLMLPLGGKFVLRGTVAPEYTWYLDSTALRGWGGVYEGGLVGLFNRLTLQADGGWARQNQLLNSEAEQATFQERSYGTARLEIDIFRRLSVFGGLEAVKTRVDEGTPVFGSNEKYSYLNRTEWGYRGGLRYKPMEQLSVAAMVERVTTQFVDQPQDRDNDSLGYLLAVHYDRPRFYIDLNGGYREATARYSPSYFPPYRTGTYGYFVSYFVAAPLELQVNGHRRPVSSMFLDNPYYFETRNGIGLVWAIGARTALRASAALGTNTYPVEVIYTPTKEVITRQDDVVDTGGGISYQLTQTLGFNLSATRSRYTSNIPGADRNVFRFGLGITWTHDFVNVGGGTKG